MGESFKALSGEVRLPKNHGRRLVGSWRPDGGDIARFAHAREGAMSPCAEGDSPRSRWTWDSAGALQATSWVSGRDIHDGSQIGACRKYPSVAVLLRTLEKRPSRNVESRINNSFKASVHMI